ncbi:hypothetical protein VIF_003657 [Vibrio cholerae TM 11079-80]|nr:hypothetical protein VIF_003657 [Vibrio cholerae TM 11079-80]
MASPNPTSRVVSITAAQLNWLDNASVTPKAIGFQLRMAFSLNTT